MPWHLLPNAWHAFNLDAVRLLVPRCRLLFIMPKITGRALEKMRELQAMVRCACALSLIAAAELQHQWSPLPHMCH